MSLCWQTDINSSAGSKNVIRLSIISSLQKQTVPDRKEDRITMVTCSVVSGQNGPPSHCWKLTLCSQSFLQTSPSPGQLFLSMVQRLGFGQSNREICRMK
ncbi:hypothetical protein AMECASPLE_016307 [Ameca splendens]|uniref:Uncharacterized protein n=1 Tax=Ameca splendens TaxID=208324 RepID=A0ABV0YE37_9TELE